MHSGLGESEYGKKAVPNVKLILYLEGRKMYSLVSTTLKEYTEYIRTDPKTHKCVPEVHMVDALMDPTDYDILIARKYDKYELEIEDTWRSTANGQDYEATRVLEFNSLKIYHTVDYGGELAEWSIDLENEI